MCWESVERQEWLWHNGLCRQGSFNCGDLILLDEKRFSRADKRSKLPKWIQQYLAPSDMNLSTDMAVGLAKNFLRNMAQPFEGSQLGISLWSEKEIAVEEGKVRGTGTGQAIPMQTDWSGYQVKLLQLIHCFFFFIYLGERCRVFETPFCKRVKRNWLTRYPMAGGEGCGNTSDVISLAKRALDEGPKQF